MDVDEKLSLTESLLKAQLNDLIENLTLFNRIHRLKVTLKDLTTIFIQYNPFEEYSYSIIFSPDEYDRIRFDNYDDKWTVSSRPHHEHIRKSEKVIQSNMNGNPKHDIPILIQVIRKELR